MAAPLVDPLDEALDVVIGKLEPFDLGIVATTAANGPALTRSLLTHLARNRPDDRCAGTRLTTSLAERRARLRCRHAGADR